jgi:phosphohistidine phosphatase SixA
MLLLRHASAGVRLSSEGVDRFRRLDESGRLVARQLVWSLADREITKVVSSPMARCIESVVPLAESRRLNVETHWELAPNASASDVLTLLEDLPDTTLACTHREILEKLFGSDVTCEKGSVWVVERHGLELAPALYLEPPSVVASGRYDRAHAG